MASLCGDATNPWCEVFELMLRCPLHYLLCKQQYSGIECFHRWEYLVPEIRNLITSVCWAISWRISMLFVLINGAHYIPSRGTTVCDCRRRDLPEGCSQSNKGGISASADAIHVKQFKINQMCVNFTAIIVTCKLHAVQTKITT